VKFLHFECRVIAGGVWAAHVATGISLRRHMKIAAFVGLAARQSLSHLQIGQGKIISGAEQRLAGHFCDGIRHAVAKIQGGAMSSFAVSKPGLNDSTVVHFRERHRRNGVW